VKRIPLSAIRNSEPRGYALVDDDDYDWLVDEGPWGLLNVGYAGRSLRKVNSRYIPRTTLMHRLILGLERGDRRQTDHIDRNRLNNQRWNLRIVTQAQNCQNRPAGIGTSRFRGVCWEGFTGRWRVTVDLNGRSHRLGRFDDEIAAALAAEAWRRENMPFASPDPVLAELLARAGYVPIPRADGPL
jgi:hypothetical protein